MPKSKAIKNMQQDDLGKGINTFTRDTMIADNECDDGYNIWATGKNSITKRPGIKKLATIAGGNPIDGLGVYVNGSERKLVAMSGGVLSSVETGAAVALSATIASCAAFTSGEKTDFVQAAGKLFIANGTEKIRYFDGAVREDTANSVTASWLIYYKSCLWAAGDPSFLTRLWRSGNDANIGNFTYDATGNPLATWIEVNKDDGTNMSGFFKHQDYLYPTKERSLWRIYVGSDEFQLINLELVDPARGCDSHRTIDTVENDNFMFNEAGLYATGYEPNVVDQIRTNIISLRVDTKIKQIQKSRLDDVVGIYHDNHYYLSYTAGGGTTNDTILVYDRQRLSWWEWQLTDINGNPTGANCFTTFKDSNGETKLYFGSSVDGSIYYFDDTAKDDAGYSIVTDFLSKKYGFKRYAQMKFFLDAELYVGKTPGNITVSVYIDGILANTRTVVIGNIGTAGIGRGIVGVETAGIGDGSLTITDKGGGNFIKLPINKLGRNIQVEVEDNNGTIGWELNSLSINYKEINNLWQPNTL